MRGQLRFQCSDQQFHGDQMVLVYNTTRTLFLYAPDVSEAAYEDRVFEGRYWLAYERSASGQAPTWSIYIDIGLDMADLQAGLQLRVKLIGFPNDPHWEQSLFFDTYTIASHEDWHTCSCSVMAPLIAAAHEMEERVAAAQSSASTDADDTDTSPIAI
jgi:hypothetical protein